MRCAYRRPFRDKILGQDQALAGLDGSMLPKQPASEPHPCPRGRWLWASCVQHLKWPLLPVSKWDCDRSHLGKELKVRINLQDKICDVFFFSSIQKTPD